MSKTKLVKGKRKKNRDWLICENIKDDFNYMVEYLYVKLHSINPNDRFKAMFILALPVVALISLCIKARKKEEKKFFFLFR